MSAQTYLFYDIESTGLNKCFDQVLQFAAIRTDLELKELERHEIRIRLNPDVIPSAGAIITHRIGVAASQSGENELDAIRTIHDLMNTPGTISLGYNTLGFDDEFLRFSFYRNLLPPYTHQYANQCSRMDLYPMTIMYYLFKPEALEWPENDGKPSFKLERLSEANQLASGPAHDAMVDVEATLALARQYIKHRSMWDYLKGCFDKKTDLKRLQKLPLSFSTGEQSFRDSLIVQNYFGWDNAYQAPMMHIGQHQHYSNQSLWLRLDTEALQTTTAESIPETTQVSRKRAGEPPFILPPEDRFLTRLDAERIALSNANKTWLTNNPELLQLICDYHQNNCYPKVDNLDVDAALYETTFPTPQETTLFSQFHTAQPTEKMKLILKFPNATHREQGLRILGRQDPNQLSESDRAYFNDYLSEVYHPDPKVRPLDYQGKTRLSIDDAQHEIKKIKTERSLAADQISLLDELETYLNSIKVKAFKKR